jgi:hypothetical protein
MKMKSNPEHKKTTHQHKQNQTQNVKENSDLTNAEDGDEYAEAEAHGPIDLSSIPPLRKSKSFQPPSSSFYRFLGLFAWFSPWFCWAFVGWGCRGRAWRELEGCEGR